MSDINSSAWLLAAVPIATSFLCLVSAIGIVAAVLLNRGAKVNLSWGLIAVGLVAFSLAEADRVLALLGMPNLTMLRDVIKLCGALLIFCGVMYGRDILRRLVK